MTKNTSDRFEKVGDAEDQVVNISGAPSPNTKPVPRPRTAEARPPGRPLPHRGAVQVDATTSETYDASMAHGLTAAAQRRLSVRRTVGQAGPSERPMLEHIFGLNLPGRDRA